MSSSKPFTHTAIIEQMKILWEPAGALNRLRTDWPQIAAVARSRNPNCAWGDDGSLYPSMEGVLEECRTVMGNLDHSVDRLPMRSLAALSFVYSADPRSVLNIVRAAQKAPEGIFTPETTDALKTAENALNDITREVSPHYMGFDSFLRHYDDWRSATLKAAKEAEPKEESPPSPSLWRRIFRRPGHDEGVAGVRVTDKPVGIVKQ